MLYECVLFSALSFPFSFSSHFSLVLLLLLRFESSVLIFFSFNRSLIRSFVLIYSLAWIVAGKQLQATELAIFRYIFIRCLCSVLVNLCDELFLMALPALDTIEHFNTHIFKWLTFMCWSCCCCFFLSFHFLRSQSVIVPFLPLCLSRCSICSYTAIICHN